MKIFFYGWGVEMVNDSKLKKNENMNIQQAIKTLNHHNSWRRGKIEENPNTPKEIGESIDIILNEIEKNNSYMTFENMSNNKIEKIINELKSFNYFKGDLSDIGNGIGIIIGKYISEDVGYEKGDFIGGFNHGVSISDGSHP